MQNNQKNTFTDSAWFGKMKPLMIFIALIIALVVTISRDYERIHKVHKKVTINEIGKIIGYEEVELTDFYIKDMPKVIKKDKAVISLYANPQAMEPKAMLFVSDIQTFQETYKANGAIFVKHFYGGIKADIGQGMKEYVSDPALKHANNEAITLFTFLEPVTWTSSWIAYSLLALGIIFVGFILFFTRIRTL